MTRPVRYVFLLGAICLLLLCSVAAYVIRRHGPAVSPTLDTLLLLVPDSANPKAPEIQLWLDAASEEGLHLAVVRDSDLLRPTAELHGAALIVPDGIHREANDALVGALYRYVQQGGKLMLVYDAATWTLRGTYAAVQSRLSTLAGVDYALYDKYGRDTMRWSEVWGSAQVMRELGIPPGKFAPLTRRGEPAAWRPVSASDTGANTQFAFTRYQYGDLSYPAFRTSGQYDGQVLLRSKAGLVAGYREVGSGGVLFVNLPLGYLVNRTDGLLLHSFLKYFAETVVGLPYLSPVPDGIGGLVMNWHIDARSGLPLLARMRKRGLFSQGPFSEHITAGPDMDVPRDARGLDVRHDPEIQHWIRFFLLRGDAIGSHGGWMHNYFGEHVNDSNAAEFSPYLEWNQQALQQVTGKPIREYSAPLGNQPQWVSHWLEQRGFTAYYFAGDSGMGPTQVYRDDIRDGQNIWAFPILHMGKQASFEEMQAAGVPESAVRSWLLDVTDYVTADHVARLLYSHPMGSLHFAPALEAWFSRTGELEREQRFRWYTMSQLADFLNARKRISWAMTAGGGNTAIIQARAASTLARQTWAVPQALYGRPAIIEGSATIRAADGLWMITAADCTSLTIGMEAKPAPLQSRGLQ